MPKETISIPLNRIEEIILIIRGQKVIVDRDLAALYGVTTKAFNQAVKRNEKKFPEDFRFQLTKTEKDELVTKCDRLANLKHSSALPSAFTEHGALMAANVLSSDQATTMSLYVVRAFVKLREIVAGNHKLAAKFAELEKQVGKHDKTLVAVVQAIQKLVEEPQPKKKRSMGFISGE